MKCIAIAGLVTASVLTAATIYGLYSLNGTKPTSNSTSKPTLNSTPCSSDTSPCIEITDGSGVVYKFNDFRFVSGGCVRLIALPGHDQHTVCGSQMKWIGQNPSQHVRGSVI